MTRTNCEELADRIVDYVDGELPADEAQIVARHLSECERCRQTAEALRRSLDLARAIWLDHLGDATAVQSDEVGATPRGCPPKTGRHGGVPLRHPRGPATNPAQRGWLYAVAAAAAILLATGLLVIQVSPQGSREQMITVEQIEGQVARAGRAAQLLAATQIVARCEGTESIVEQQRRYILREYADTPAAESIKAGHNLKLGGMQK